MGLGGIRYGVELKVGSVGSPGVLCLVVSSGALPTMGRQPL